MPAMNVTRRMLYGALAGAAGTCALDIVTYLDMLARNRPPSELPQRMARVFASKLGFEQIEKNRLTALGALLGYADGIGTGVLFGIMRPAAPGISETICGVGLCVMTGLVSEGTATLLKQTDPREWSVADWAGDIVPRMVYGLVTTIAFDALAGGAAE